MRLNALIITAAASSLILTAAGEAAAAPTAGASGLPGAASAQSASVLFFDDFKAGFTPANWTVYGGNAVPTTSSSGLKVVAGGTNPATGDPEFTDTVGPGGGDGTGVADHGKWLALVNHTASSGYPGFDAVAGQAVGCQAALSGQTYGTAAQPFGSALVDPSGDPRLASVALVAGDLETGLLFDVFVTNDRIWARYESVLSVTGGTNPASFGYMVPVATRKPGERDQIGVTFDKSAGVVSYAVNGSVVLRVGNLGSRPADRSHLTVDHGGVDRIVSPRQFACGLGMFTLLDDRIDCLGPSGSGLVRLATGTDFYYDPVLGPPTLADFLDNQSLPGDRLWGQGAALETPAFAVVSSAAGQ